MLRDEVNNISFVVFRTVSSSSSTAPLRFDFHWGMGAVFFSSSVWFLPVCRLLRSSLFSSFISSRSSKMFCARIFAWFLMFLNTFYCLQPEYFLSYNIITLTPSDACWAIFRAKRRERELVKSKKGDNNGYDDDDENWVLLKWNAIYSLWYFVVLLDVALLGLCTAIIIIIMPSM